MVVVDEPTEEIRSLLSATIAQIATGNKFKLVKPISAT
jgi:hypothetical protein